MHSNVKALHSETVKPAATRQWREAPLITSQSIKPYKQDANYLEVHFIMGESCVIAEKEIRDAIATMQTLPADSRQPALGYRGVRRALPEGYIACNN